MERPNPFTAQLAPPGIDSHRFYSDMSDQQNTIGEQVSPELREYFAGMIELFENDNDEAMEGLSAALTGDAGIQPLLPLFLQFMAGRLTVSLRDTSVVRRVALLGLALVNNLSLPIHFFVHAFIRTAMTVLLRYDTGPSIDDDIEVRHIGANFLHEICVRCASGFPTIAAVAQNALISAWLCPRATHPSQLGAFIGICTFGRPAVMRLLPHIPGYLKSIRRELALGKAAKRPIIATVLVDIKQLLEEQLQEMKEQAKWEALLAEITALANSCEDQ
jgi:transcription initiation factor TFIID subunit 6